MNEGDPLIWQLLLQLVLIMLNAVFACAEIAIISINDNKLERLSAAGDKRAAKLVALTKQPAKFLATIQVGITLAGFLGSAFAADNFSDKLVDVLILVGVTLPARTLDTIAVIVITLILSYLTLILGELVPKRIAMQNAEKLGLFMAAPLFYIAKVFAPVVWFLTKSTNGLLRLLGIDPDANDEEVTEEEIRMMVDVGSENGTIDEDEKDIIHNVFEFDNKTADDVKTHRTEVVVLWLEESDEEWAKIINESRYSCYPICDESVDDVVGVLYIKDYFRMEDRNREQVLKYAVRPAQFVPETVRTDILFRNMKSKKNHFAVVLDEYGGMGGVVTINDLLEQLVGDLDDDINEIDELPLIEQLDTGTWRIDGAADLEDVAKALGVSLPADEYETFSGLVFGCLGTVPEDGETPELEEYGLTIRVTEIKEHRMKTAVVGVI